jgi:hypothetical protein
MVGTRPTVRPAARASRTAARTSATVRTVLTAPPRRRLAGGQTGRGVGQRVPQRQELGLARLHRGALAGDRRVVAAGDGAVSARSGPSAAQCSTVARTSGTRTSRPAPAGSRRSAASRG